MCVICPSLPADLKNNSGRIGGSRQRTCTSSGCSPRQSRPGGSRQGTCASSGRPPCQSRPEGSRQGTCVSSGCPACQFRPGGSWQGTQASSGCPVLRTSHKSPRPRILSPPQTLIVVQEEANYYTWAIDRFKTLASARTRNKVFLSACPSPTS
jgi:hypothetical protein